MAVDQQVLPPAVRARTGGSPRAATATTLLFTVTAFLGAALLFLVEPLVAKLLLPEYGGSATVWSTSTLFFQLLLLLAYGYSHWSTARLRHTWQPRAHLVVLALPVLALPLTVPADAVPPADAMPALWLIRTLFLLVGLPFVVVATTGPLLQKWYSWTSSRRADDPYFLFAASNLGSFVGLLAYPLWVEPTLTLVDQRIFWSVAYGVFLVLTAACALVAGLQRPRATASTPDFVEDKASRRPSNRRKLAWVALAMLPSTLMLGVTAHLSTDVASIPLLWVVPLAIYLGSFVLAFARKSRTVPVTATRVAVALGLLEVVTALGGPIFPVYVSITTSLLMLAAVAFASHVRLAVERPATEHLTGFYMVVAVGGALGGLLNGLVAPVIFSGVVEYPIALSAVPFLLFGSSNLKRGWLSRQMRTNGVRATCVVIVTCVALIGLRVAIAVVTAGVAFQVLLLLVALLVAWSIAQHPQLALAAVLFLYSTNAVIGRHGVIEQTRTFYGTYRIVGNGEQHTFVHGTTVHGTQFADARRRDVPTRTTPSRARWVTSSGGERAVDSKMSGRWAWEPARWRRTAGPGQHFTFFEIDPEVVRIAKDPHLFTYLKDSPASVTTVTGDGRLNLAKVPPRSFDLVILDAFSSDAIPVHLLTQEAVHDYADRLRPGGVLAFHITNRVFDLGPVLNAAASKMGWTAEIGTDNSPAEGASHSTWVVMGPPDSRTLRTLADRPGWERLTGPGVTWTDDYSSVLSVLR